ncbi:hypothetical protein Bfsp1_33 [Cytobacillus phage Bfsp1]|nr:hypothetical protein Bfsp1_33 [Cytobacillus phage Bfsp1]
MLLSNQTKAQFDREVTRQIENYSEQKVKYDWNWLKKESSFGPMTEVKFVNRHYATIIRFDAETQILSTKELIRHEIEDLEKMFFELQD